MTKHSFPMRAVFCAALLLVPAAQLLFAQQPPELPPPNQALTPDQLDDLVAPVALYPDPLVSQILVASTYPLELVQALQWLQRNPGLTGAALTQAAQQQNWDPSIQALVIFPDLVKRLNQDITWTTNLGNAFLNQQADVMDAVQRMRSKAQQAGKLASTPQQTVTTTNDNGQPEIVIEPANPQVIYLPNYDPAYFWGPPLYYPYASWFYPPYGGGAYWGFGMGIPMGMYFGGGWGGWGGWGWGFGWGGHSVMINNGFIHRYNFNSRGIGSLNGRSAWSHDASHRQGVPYSNSAVSSRYGGNVRQNLQSRGNAGQAQVRGANPQSGAERMGNRQVSAPAKNRSAFGGVREGSAVRTQSDHGYSSLGPARSGASAPRGGGGAPSRGGGGGGAPSRGGGGGGGGNRGGGHR
jgi:Protein of unknown function (DUF3300)